MCANYFDEDFIYGRYPDDKKEVAEAIAQENIAPMENTRPQLPQANVTGQNDTDAL
jgi:hypothetical protein